MSTAVSTTGPDEPAKPAARKIEIDPSFVALNTEGFCWREILVRLPEDATAASLNEDANLWRQVQQSVNSLRKFDHLLIAAYDESWIAQAIVSHASSTSVSLAAIKVYEMPERRIALPEDDEYRTRWAGKGYRLERKRDNALIGDYMNSIWEVERALRNRYARPVI
jgi:hypothetical protein